nr:MAG TPA: hypothetical protein [Caudoviricetes sp.]
MTICMENARTRCFGFAYRMSYLSILCHPELL